MSGITPIPPSRISDQFASSLLLEQFRNNQSTLLKIQQEISTGRQVIVPSDNPPASARAIDLQRLLERKSQFKTNLQTNQSYLSATDSALASVSDLLNEARGVALSASGTTVTDDQRATAAQQIDSILQQLVNTANEQFNGRYLFAGSNTGVQPFLLAGGFVQYRGNATQLQSYSDINLLFPTNVAGSDVFGALSAPNRRQFGFESEPHRRYGPEGLEWRTRRELGKHQSFRRHPPADYRPFQRLHRGRHQTVARSAAGRWHVTAGAQCANREQRPAGFAG